MSNQKEIQAPAQAYEGHVVMWNHDRTRILAVTRQNTEGQILKVIAEAPAQAAPSAGEVERGDVVAFEFYNRATGHAIVDYSVNTHVGTLGAERGYEARPLVYARRREKVTDGSKPIPLWQAREALDELEASARGDAPFNHHAAAVVRAALESAEQPRQMVALTEAARDVLAERQRQISAEAKYGDAEHENGELAIAAACYALIAERGLQVATLQIPKLWEWTGWRIEGFKPRDKRRNLVKAGALILAEIERLDRASGIPAPGGKE